MHQQLFDRLHEDHEFFKSTLESLLETGQQDTEERTSLLEKLKSELLPHMHGEEKGFYALLRDHAESKMKALESMEEHHVASIVLQELDSMDKSDEVWGAKLQVFQELIEHHIREEETEVFEKARQALSENQAHQALDIFDQEKQAAVA
jgi:hemerythrin-like domain-containing protein